jgi:RNA 2',3'-cyclic 3'-phosphodiesterase
LAEPTTQRLFFALWPDEAVRAQLRAAQDALPRRGGRPVHVEDIHVTLAFLGPVEAERRACMEAAAAGVRGEAFELVIDRQGYWPRPRVAWCAPAAIPEPLRTLVQRLNRALEPCGFEPERRAYSPHVTLFRDSRAVPEGPLERSVRWPCREFVLVASANVPGGPRYRVLGRWPLADSCNEPPPCHNGEQKENEQSP